MIEQVRSLRQSTIAKRSNAAPLSSTKKAPGKTVSTPKAGVKQLERCQVKEEACASLKSEYYKESRRSSRHTGQIKLESEESEPSSHSSLSSCLEMNDKVEIDSKQNCPNQREAKVPCHELNCPLLSETCVNIEEKKSETLTESKIKTDSNPFFNVSDKEEHEQNDPMSDKMDQNIVGEMREKGKIEQESIGGIELPQEDDQIIEGSASSVTLSDAAAFSSANQMKKSLADLSSSVDEVKECNLELKNTKEVTEKDKSSFQRHDIEPVDYCKDTESSDKPNTELSESNLEVVDTSPLELESNILENAVCDVSDQNSKQLNTVETVKMESHEAANIQDDKNSQSHTTTSSESKNTKSKHIKPAIPSKQNITMDNMRNVDAKHELVHNKTKAHVKNVKRNADGAESQQHFHRSAKVRKKQVDKDTKTQTCNSGVKSVKNQAHPILKRPPQDPNVVQISKPLVHSLTDKPHGQPGCSKESQHSAQTGHLLHQKQCHKPQQLVTAVKTNIHMKEELEQTSVEHLKEEDKLKLKKPERNLQPRQRRSSRNFSLDEPPLFIPDNIATVKREGSDHSSSFESKYMWTPSKHCGFCKKPHGNRCVCVCVCVRVRVLVCMCL